jgi:hypothetical protein
MLPHAPSAAFMMAEPVLTRVALIGLGTLLDDSLLALLKHTRFAVEVLPFADTADILNRLHRTNPDIVILNMGGALDLIELVAALFRQPRFGALSVLGVHPDTNSVTVCTKADLVLSEGRQLLDLLQQDPSRFLPA